MNDQTQKSHTVDADNNTTVSVYGKMLEIAAKTSSKQLTAVFIEKENVVALITLLMEAHSVGLGDISPVGGVSSKKCAGCGVELNDGEAATFTVCDTCWDLKYKTPTPSPVEHVRQMERDSERLDWLDSKKAEHHAHWGGGPRADDSTYWVDPSASWSVKHLIECGTYEYPPALATISIREAIDIAIYRTQKTILSSQGGNSPATSVLSPEKDWPEPCFRCGKTGMACRCYDLVQPESASPVSSVERDAQPLEEKET